MSAEKADTLFIVQTDTLLSTPEYIEAQKLWAEGLFWEVHEALEPLWMRLQGQQRELTHGIILLAAALHKAKTNPTGGQRNFAKALKHLDGIPEIYEGIRVADLINETRRALAHPPYQPVFTRV